MPKKYFCLTGLGIAYVKPSTLAFSHILVRAKAGGFVTMIYWALRYLLSLFFPKKELSFDGDIVLLGNSRVEIDLNNKKVSKYYSTEQQSEVFFTNMLHHLDELPELHQYDVDKGAITTNLIDTNLSKIIFTRYSTNQKIQICKFLSNNSWGQTVEVHTPSYLDQLKQKTPAKWQNIVKDLFPKTNLVTELTELALSHGDLKKENILWSKHEFKFIDWELCSIRQKRHDIFNVFLHPVIHRESSALKSLNTDIETLYKKFFSLNSRNSFWEMLHIFWAEKLVLYTSSGRWKGQEQLAVDDLLFAIKQLSIIREAHE